MAHVEFSWVAKWPLKAEHPLGSGEIVEYAPGDVVPANEWGQAAHHLEANDKIMQVAVNVSDPGDGPEERESPGPARGLSDPTRQFLAYEGQAPLSDEEPALEPSDEEADEGDEGDADTDAAGFPAHQGGGVYELSDGSTVRGKRRAVAAQAVLDEG